MFSFLGWLSLSVLWRNGHGKFFLILFLHAFTYLHRMHHLPSLVSDFPFVVKMTSTRFVKIRSRSRTVSVFVVHCS